MTDKDQTVNRFKYRTQIGVAAKDRKGDPRETPSQKMEETKAAHDHAPQGKRRRT